MIDYTGTYTDQYQLAMAQVYFLEGHQDERAVFDYFFRKLPFGGGYAIFAGLEDLLAVLEHLRFDDRDIAFLREQGALIDLYGVGTSLVTGRPDAALDGVYKLAFAGGKPRIKLSETRAKITLPFKKQGFRILDDDGNFWGADVAALEDEEDIGLMHHPSDPHKSLSVGGYQQEPLLQKVMEDGKRLHEPQSLTDLKEYSRKRLAQLPEEYKRFDNPHIYKVGLSDRLKRERDKLIAKHQEEVA